MDCVLPTRIARNGTAFTKFGKLVIRNAEYNVNQLWSAWCQKFKDKTSNEVLGMVAFQFAKLYQTLANRENATNDILEKFEENLNEYLLKIDAEGK